MAQYTDGWHKICGYDVYIENGEIVRGVSDDWSRPLYVYRLCRNGDGYDREEHITPAAFRAGLKRGTVKLF